MCGETRKIHSRNFLLWFCAKSRVVVSRHLVQCGIQEERKISLSLSLSRISFMNVYFWKIKIILEILSHNITWAIVGVKKSDFFYKHTKIHVANHHQFCVWQNGVKGKVKICRSLFSTFAPLNHKITNLKSLESRSHKTIHRLKVWRRRQEKRRENICVWKFFVYRKNHKKKERKSRCVCVFVLR